MMSDDTKQLNVAINSDVYEGMMSRLEHGERTEIFREVARKIAAGEYDAYTVNDIKLGLKRDEIEDQRETVRQAQARLERLESERDDILRDREHIQTETDRYDGMLWSFEQRFRAGEVGHAIPKKNGILNIYKEFDKNFDEIIGDLRDRNPDVPDHAFEDEEQFQMQSGSISVFDGLSEERVDLPVEDRDD